MEIVLKYPSMLLLFLAVPAMIMLHYYFFEHNKKKAMKFANFSALKRVTGTHLITKNNSQLGLRIVALSMLIIASARPSFWYEGKSSITEYVIALDSSASMVATDVLPDRLTVAKQAASSFINSLKGETKVGLVSFSGVSIIKNPPTSDRAEIKESITNIGIELSGGTDIGSALITSINLMSQEDKSKAVILITDGSDTAGSFVEESTETALEYVKSAHVIVHTIGIGSGLGSAGYLEDPGLMAVYKKDTLQQIAEQTGGKFYEVKNSAEIAAAFMDINQEYETAKISYDSTPLFYTLGIILLFFEWVLLNTKFRALP